MQVAAEATAIPPQLNFLKEAKKQPNLSPNVVLHNLRLIAALSESQKESPLMFTSSTGEIGPDNRWFGWAQQKSDTALSIARTWHSVIGLMAALEELKKDAAQGIQKLSESDPYFAKLWEEMGPSLAPPAPPLPPFTCPVPPPKKEKPAPHEEEQVEKSFRSVSRPAGGRLVTSDKELQSVLAGLRRTQIQEKKEPAPGEIQAALQRKFQDMGYWGDGEDSNSRGSSFSFSNIGTPSRIPTPDSSSSLSDSEIEIYPLHLTEQERFPVEAENHKREEDVPLLQNGVLASPESSDYDYDMIEESSFPPETHQDFDSMFGDYGP